MSRSSQPKNAGIQGHECAVGFAVIHIQPSSELLTVTYETVTSLCPGLKSLEDPYESNTFNVAVTAWNRSGKVKTDFILDGQIVSEVNNRNAQPAMSISMIVVELH